MEYNKFRVLANWATDDVHACELAEKNLIVKMK